jgi:hypothetical protein
MKPGLAPFTRYAIVTDLSGRRESLQVNADFLTVENGQAYLPIGIVYRDQEKILIELPHEADSGTHRLWVAPANVHERVDGDDLNKASFVYRRE